MRHPCMAGSLVRLKLGKLLRLLLLSLLLKATIELHALRRAGGLYVHLARPLGAPQLRQAKWPGTTCCTSGCLGGRS